MQIDPIQKIVEKMAEEKSVEIDTEQLRLRKPTEMSFKKWRKELKKLVKLKMLRTIINNAKKENKKSK